VKCSANIINGGRIIVPAKKLIGCVQYLPQGEMSFELNAENNQIVLKGGNTKYTIQGIDPELFPEDLPIETKSKTVAIDKKTLVNMIRRTQFAASIDQSRGIITGVLLEFEENILNMVALDGFRMAIAREPIMSNINDNIIVPARMLKDLSKILSLEKNEDNITLRIFEKKLVIEFAAVKISARLMSGEFLQYRNLLPLNSPIQVAIRTEELNIGLERTTPITKENSKSNYLKFNISEKEIVLSSRSDTDKIIQEIPCTRNYGENIEIGFNGKFMSSIIKEVDDDFFIFELCNPVSPTIIKPVEGNYFEYLLLPVRIK
jgi:DNA polymerase-3 subunit beta